MRGPERLAVDDRRGREVALAAGTSSELGAGADVVSLAVAITIDEAARVVAFRKIDDFAPAESRVETDAGSLRALYEAQKAIGAADDLHEVVEDRGRLPRARGARNPRHGGPARRRGRGARGIAGYVLIATRGARARAARRGKPIPVARSVFRKVVIERAAVIAADAPAGGGADRSNDDGGADRWSRTLAVPVLARGGDPRRPFQLDNRQSTGVLTSADSSS